MAVSSEPLVINNQSVLQKHASFFDRNKDGVIYPWETFQGCRALGLGIGISTLAAVFINLGLSGKTRPGKYLNLLFPVEIQNITKAKRKGDTGVYDAEGNFDPAKFEEIFLKHSQSGNALTLDEMLGLLKPKTSLKDYPGYYGGWLGWKSLHAVCKDKNGLVQKETLRAFYTGGLFKKIEQERAARK
ncbi:probable peroxygenase 4 [Papaver somniferum]|uniref:probable peroxygenase 4 n=1 Tax=Papaver somniferum TaxID=3469 RepID=UPI000E7010C7|nr:probable peroxygenase 4 [Papaver somniferum]